MKCVCKNNLIQKSASGGMDLRIKGKVTIDDAGLHASCFWCSAPVTLPIELKKSVLPSTEERFVIAPKNQRSK